MGRKPKEFDGSTRDLVRSWVISRVARIEIARRLHLDIKTLGKHFAEELGDAKLEPSDQGKIPAREKSLEAFKPNDDQLGKTEVLRARGWEPKRIYRVLGLPISFEEFQVVFAEALDVGADRRLAAAEVACYVKGVGGNATLLNQWFKRTDLEPPPGMGGQSAPAPPRAPSLGKKAEAALAAETGSQGTEWDGLVDDDALPN